MNMVIYFSTAIDGPSRVRYMHFAQTFSIYYWWSLRNKQHSNKHIEAEDEDGSIERIENKE